MKRTTNASTAANELGGRILLMLEFIEGTQDFPGAPQIREIVEDAVRVANLRTLRLIAKDVDEMTLTLAPHERDGLESLLKTRFGFDSDGAWAAEREAANRAVARGHIASEKERQRLERHLEALVVRGAPQVDVTALRTLLTRG